MQIEVNYFNSQKPKGVVGGKPTIQQNQKFRFFSHDGKLEVQFVGDSPVEGDVPPQKLPDNTDFVATKPGHYTFQCFINGHPIPHDGGGEMDVPPAV